MSEAAYVLVRSDDLHAGRDLLLYLTSVDDTFARYGGRILVQNFPTEVVEGEWSGFVTLLQFDDLVQARKWYHSPEYQTIQILRASSSSPTVIMVKGVPSGHRSTDLIDGFGLKSS